MLTETPVGGGYPMVEMARDVTVSVMEISTEFVRPGGKVGDELISVGEVVKMGMSTSHCTLTLLHMG
jgi:hypothetical protein